MAKEPKMLDDLFLAAHVSPPLGTDASATSGSRRSGSSALALG